MMLNISSCCIPGVLLVSPLLFHSRSLCEQVMFSYFLSRVKNIGWSRITRRQQNRNGLTDGILLPFSLGVRYTVFWPVSFLGWDSLGPFASLFLFGDYLYYLLAWDWNWVWQIYYFILTIMMNDYLNTAIILQQNFPPHTLEYSLFTLPAKFP